MFCPNCGKEIEDDSLFCSGCGSKVTEDPVSSPAEAPAEEEVLFDGRTEEVSSTAEYCPNCGKKVIEKGDSFCLECGYRVQEAPKRTETVEGVPVLDIGGENGEEEIVCRMCKCKIPASASFCPVCSQPVIKEAAVSGKETRSTSRLNVFSLIGFICSLCFGILTPVASSALGLVFGILGMKKSKNEYGGSGKGFALAAIIISAVVLFICLIAYMVLLEEGGYYYEETDGNYFYY